MNILVAVNQKFIPPLKVLLGSLLHSHKTLDAVDVYLFHAALTGEDIAVLEGLRGRYANFRLHPVRVDLSQYDYLQGKGVWSVETFFRLLMLKYLPEDMDRVLWLDADTLVRKSIADFYGQPLGNTYGAVCRYPHAAESLMHLKRLRGDFGPMPQDDTFCAGVILFNLRQLRLDFTQDAFVEFYRDHKEKMRFLDQDLLNVMLGHNVVWADARYQYCVPSRTYVNVIRRWRPPVLHFINDLKPWAATFYRPGYALIYAWHARRVGIKIPLPAIFASSLRRIVQRRRFIPGYCKSHAYRILVKLKLVRRR